MNKAKERCEEIVSIIIKSEPDAFKELNIKTLAKSFGIKYHYLSDTFKKYIGVNLSEYITRLITFVPFPFSCPVFYNIR
jgi:YesN/AraC family two-component response regulator